MGAYNELLRPRTSSVVQDAGFLRRAFGFVVDILLLDLLVTAPFTPVLAGLVAKAEGAGFFSFAYTQKELAAIVVLFLIIYLYFVLFEYTLGQTVGMMLMRTQVKSGTQLWRPLVRNSFLIPVFPFVLFWIIEPLSILFFRRGLLEHLSNTRTVYRRQILI